MAFVNDEDLVEKWAENIKNIPVIYDKSLVFRRAVLNAP